MKAWRQNRAQQRSGGKTERRARASLAAHRAFAPMLGLWGAALAGLTTLVLPEQTVAAAIAGTSLALLGTPAQFVIAFGAALLLGGAMFIIAASLSRRTRHRADPPSIVAVAARGMRPIDPVSELGSHSLDEPVADIPFAIAPQPDADMPPAPPPRALDLNEFSELPGRNAVWVEDAPNGEASDEPLLQQEPVAAVASPEPVFAPAPVGPAAAPDPGAAAITRLRATPPDELSLVQMVERFAAALHDHRVAAPGAAGHNRELAARDAALAEALKALAALSTDTPAPEHEGEPLRDALTRLQGLRGAA